MMNSLNFYEEGKCSNANSRRKVYVIANGCPENRIDGARIQEFFKQNGWTATEALPEADLIVFNACGLTQNNETHSIETIKGLKAKGKASADLIVCGCLPKINKDKLSEAYQGPTFGSDELEPLNEIFKAEIKTQNVHANYLLPLTVCSGLASNFKQINSIGILKALSRLLRKDYRSDFKKLIGSYNPKSFCVKVSDTVFHNSATFSIKVSTGCLSSCSYCAVRLSRGRLKSKPVSRIVKEFEEGLAKGFQEFSLMGTDLGAYGRDQGINLAILLKELLKKDGNYKIKLPNIQPCFLIPMMPDLREVFQSGKITYLSSAAQSGNNRILGLMKRGYRIEDFKEAILTLNNEFPEIRILSQLMVGFPGETEEEFQDTIRLLDEVNFDFIHLYIFSPRPNTLAAKMGDQIPPKVAKKRFVKLFIKSQFMGRKRKKQVALAVGHNKEKTYSSREMVHYGVKWNEK